MSAIQADKRENILKAIRFEKPDYIPMSFHINRACWDYYEPAALIDLMAAHPFLFPDIDSSYNPEAPGLNQRAGEPYSDPWGCVWETSIDGITGSVRTHPLAEWADFQDYTAPDPGRFDGTFPVNWRGVAEGVAKRRETGDIVQLGLPHGHTFLRLLDIRGYTQLLFDMADVEPRLLKLIDMVADFNLDIVKRMMQLQPDIMGYAEDLGMQVGPMLSPGYFRSYIKPVYQRLMKPARDADVIVHMHSDGDIRTLAEDLIEGGVEVLNLQDLVNGIDWIASTYRGRVCIELDVDRQLITPRGTADEIDALVREEVEKLACPDGGLMLIYGLYPGVPMENAAALMTAMERYAY